MGTSDEGEIKMNKMTGNEILMQLTKLAIVMNEDVKNGRLPKDLAIKYHKIFERDLMDKIAEFGVKED